jgi:hypothetical protein
MAVNHYFNELTFGPEQGLIDDLNVEAISIHGWDAWFLPRKLRNEDGVLNEDSQSYYDQYMVTTFYLKNAEGFQGPGTFLSSMGLEIRNQITLTVSLTTWSDEVGPLSDFRGGTTDRPREGDLVWFPQNQKLFEIVFVEKHDVFFQLGRIYTVDLTCQLMEWTGQEFNTGIAAIDNIQKTLSEDLFDWALLAEDGAVLLHEDGAAVMLEEYETTKIDPFDQKDAFQDLGSDIFDFTETDPFSEGRFT